MGVIKLCIPKPLGSGLATLMPAKMREVEPSLLFFIFWILCHFDFFFFLTLNLGGILKSLGH
jgi:hypothetical protein